MLNLIATDQPHYIIQRIVNFKISIKIAEYLSNVLQKIFIYKSGAQAFVAVKFLQPHLLEPNGLY